MSFPTDGDALAAHGEVIRYAAMGFAFPEIFRPGLGVPELCPPAHVDIGDGRGCIPVEEAAAEVALVIDPERQLLRASRAAERAGNVQSPEGMAQAVRSARALGRDVRAGDGMVYLEDLSRAELEEGGRQLVADMLPGLPDEFLGMDPTTARREAARLSALGGALQEAVEQQSFAALIAVGSAFAGVVIGAIGVAQSQGWAAAPFTAGASIVIAALVALVFSLILWAETSAAEDSAQLIEGYDALAWARNDLKETAFTEVSLVGYPPHLAREIAAHLDNFIEPLAVDLASTYFRSIMGEGGWTGCENKCAFLPHLGGFWGDCCKAYGKAKMRKQAPARRTKVQAVARLLCAYLQPAVYCCDAPDENCCYLESRGGWYVPVGEGEVGACDPCGVVTLTMAELAERFNADLNEQLRGPEDQEEPGTGGSGLLPLALVGGLALLAAQG